MKKGNKRTQTLFSAIYSDPDVGDVSLGSTLSTTPKGAWKLAREHNVYLPASKSIADMKKAGFKVVKYTSAEYIQWTNTGNGREAVSIIKGKQAALAAKMTKQSAVAAAPPKSWFTTELQVIIVFLIAAAIIGWILS